MINMKPYLTFHTVKFSNDEKYLPKTPEIKTKYQSLLITDMSSQHQKKHSLESKQIKFKIKNDLNAVPRTPNYKKIYGIHKNMYLINRILNLQARLPPKPQLNKTVLNNHTHNFDNISKLTQNQSRFQFYQHENEFKNIVIDQEISKMPDESICRAFWADKGKFIAIKTLDLKKYNYDQLINNINLSRSFNHINILKLLGAKKEENKLLIYMDLMQGGTIKNLIDQYGPLSEHVIKNFVKQIVEGLSYLHKLKIYYQDLRVEMIFNDGKGNIKLSNFGYISQISKPINQQQLFNNKLIYWMPPEIIIENKKLSRKVDIWSLGCTIIEMASGKHPWKQCNSIKELKQLMRQKRMPQIPSHLSTECQQLVKLCLSYDSSTRPSLQQLKKLKFFEYF